jgi:hypothetical protein
MMPARRSAIRVMPKGAGQPLICATTGPEVSAWISRMQLIVAVDDSTAKLIMRWTLRCRKAMIDSAAPSSGNTMGMGRSAFTSDHPAGRRPGCPSRA